MVSTRSTNNESRFEEVMRRLEAVEQRNAALEQQNAELLHRVTQGPFPLQNSDPAECADEPEHFNSRHEEDAYAARGDKVPREEEESSHPTTGGMPRTQIPTQNDLHEMAAKIQREVMKDLKLQTPDDLAIHATTDMTQSPFTEEIEAAEFPKKFALPTFTLYDGTKDPLDHIYQVQTKMTVYGRNQALLCKVFSTSLTEAPLLWFRKQTPGSISSWNDLCRRFIGQYFSNRRQRKTISSLFTMTQEKGESLKNFLSRFNVEMSSIDDCDQLSAVEAFRMAIIPGTKFHSSLVKRPPVNIGELNSRAQGYLRIEEEEAVRHRRASLVTVEAKSKERMRDQRPQRQDPPRQTSSSRNSDKRQRTEERTTPLKTSLGKLFQENKNKGIFRPPPPMRQPMEQRDMTKHCAFHSEYGHHTNDCRNLRRQVEAMIAKGELADYVMRDQPRPDKPHKTQPNSTTSGQPVRVIHMIQGGEEALEAEGSRRSKLRKAHKLRRVGEVCQTTLLQGESKIMFSKADMQNIQMPHEDPLVITLLVANCLIKRVMIDPGSSTNIMTKWAFDKIGIDVSQLHPARIPLAGFDGRRVEPIGVVHLSVSAARRTLREAFVVVDVKPSYNLLMGRGWIHRMQGVPSTLHQVMRCLDPNGVDVTDIPGDQVAAKECYSVCMKDLNQKDKQVLEASEEPMYNEK